MKKVLSLKIDENLLDRLDKTSKAKGVSRSFLIKKGLEMVTARKSDDTESMLLRKITLALKNNKAVPVKTDWKTLQKKILQSPPQFPSADEAVAKSRRRS